MILEKYQIVGNKTERGYSTTSIVSNLEGKEFFAKWIRGIDKKSQAGKIFSDKLRSLKKVKNKHLPEIIEYGFDEDEKSYCIIYQNINGQGLTERHNKLHPIYFLKGILQLINTLQELQQQRIFHEDIHPDNILVDNENNFYLIDLGLSKITTTLSQAKDIEVFAKNFSAPEKWNVKIKNGFPFQSDIYSIGKVIEWFFIQREIESEQITELITELCQENPENRKNYNQLILKLESIVNTYSTVFDNDNISFVSFKIYYDYQDQFLTELNKAKFDISPKSGDNILMNIVTPNFLASGLWLIADKELKILNLYHKSEQSENWAKTNKFGKKIGFEINFISRNNSSWNTQSFDLTLHFRNIQKEKQAETEYRKGKQNVYNELDFYKELLEKELDVIEKNSLRIRYTRFEKKNDIEISFYCANTEKYSQRDKILNHIDIASSPKSDEYEYQLSKTSNKKQTKEPVLFSGIPYDWDEKHRIIKFKDCENLNFDKIPTNGYLFENIAKQEEEKKRQLQTMQKVKFNEVQNRDLIHTIFNPSVLKNSWLPSDELQDIYQTDEQGNRFEYSYNQTKSILNAIHRKPLTVIQGPPGTGKTTVITEIVLQLLEKNPDFKILITSQTNDAVDNVLDNLLKKDIPFIRLSGVRKPRLQSLQKHTLDRKIEGWKTKTTNKAKSYFGNLKREFNDNIGKENALFPSIANLLITNKKWKTKRQQLENLLERFSQFRNLIKHLSSQNEFIEAFDNISQTNIKQYFELFDIHQNWIDAVISLDENSSINQKLVDSIRVVGATCNHIAAKKYSKYSFAFDYVIMDEAGKATTAEALVPIIYGDNLVFVGDHRQLRPMLTSTRDVEKWLREKYKQEAEILEFNNWDDYFNRASLFEQIITSIDENYKSQLTECRRSSEDQVLLTSKCFYEPFGDEEIISKERLQEEEHNLDLKIETSILFFDIGHSYRSQKDGNQSPFNTRSAELIPQLLKEFDKIPQVKDYSFGIITGYKAQLRKINSELQKLHGRNKLRNIKSNSDQLAVSVVDRFQGLEKDIIIMDLVRTGHDNTLGFLANANRINVALSRQKRLLIIVGDYNGLVNVKSPKGEAPLQKYLKLLKPEWVVNNFKQVF